MHDFLGRWLISTCLLAFGKGDSHSDIFPLQGDRHTRRKLAVDVNLRRRHANHKY